MAADTAPGVYISEIPNGQHTISGVATSIAAFIGWAPQGLVNQAVMVESWSEYQAAFGGMIPGVYLGYAVYQFFQNGGAQAYIVRLVDAGSSATASSVIGGLQIYASSPGAWGNGISIAITNVKSVLLPSADTTFNLQVIGSSGQTLESYTNLSITPTSSTYAVAVVNGDSSYVTFTPPATGIVPNWSAAPPTVTATTSSAATSTILGSVAGVTSFVSGETVKQNVTGAMATLGGSVGNTGPMIVKTLAGTPDATDTWVGQTSGAEFVPTALPFTATLTVPVGLSAGSGTVVSGANGTTLVPNQALFETALNGPNGYALLTNLPIFNLLCVPGENSAAIVPSLLNFCFEHRAFLIVDSDLNANMSVLAIKGPVDFSGQPYSTKNPSYGAFYYPWIQAPDPQSGLRPALFPPCGYVAGAYATTDGDRGIWKAPAGIQVGLNGSLGLQVVLTDQQNGDLNQMAVNCLRQFKAYGNVVWGARTMDGSDVAGSQYKYIPIRRLALYIEGSLYKGTQWVVFEPNGEPLWGQVRGNVSSFLQGLFLQGAFAGTTPQTAYFVKCDADNNPPASIALGVVNITVGFAPSAPAEFVVIQITQILNSRSGTSATAP